MICWVPGTGATLFEKAKKETQAALPPG